MSILPVRLAAACLASALALGVAPPATAQVERLISCDTGLGQPAPFIRECRQEARNYPISDPEFNPEEFLVAWATNPSVGSGGTARADGELFVARVDPLTGVIREGTVQRIRGAPAPRRSVRNGPEWAVSRRGWEIFYSCITPDRDGVQLCKLTRAGARFSPELLPGSRGLSMRTPTTNPNSRDPKIYTELLEGSISLGYESAGFNVRTDASVPEDQPMRPAAKMGRWMPGGRALLHVEEARGASGDTFNQIVLFDTETGRSVPLFSDERNRFDPQPWEAPELDGQIAFSAMVLNEETGFRDVEVYRQGEGGGWVLWNRIPPVCSTYPNVWSPEPFVHAGRSYLSMSGVRGVNPQVDPGIVWIASVDPDLPAGAQVRRLISNDDCAADDLERRDPESLVVTNGNYVRIYFLETEN